MITFIDITLMNIHFFKRSWTLCRDTFKAFQKDQVMLLSAAIAFYAIFSLPGIVIIVIRISSVFLGEKMVKGTLNDKLGDRSGVVAAGNYMFHLFGKKQLFGCVHSIFEKQIGVAALAVFAGTQYQSHFISRNFTVGGINLVSGTKIYP